jgi:hypothetical protein
VGRPESSPFCPSPHNYKKKVNIIIKMGFQERFMMDKKRAINLAVLIIPWLTVPFIRKKFFFRFLPVASFIGFFLSVFSAVANKKKWWITKAPLFSGIPLDIPFIFGPYFVGTLWVFKLFFGNFPKYLLTNIALDLVNAFPLFYLLNKAEVVKFKNMKYTTWYIISIFLAIIIYGLQHLVEKSIRETSS